MHRSMMVGYRRNYYKSLSLTFPTVFLSSKDRSSLQMTATSLMVRSPKPHYEIYYQVFSHNTYLLSLLTTSPIPYKRYCRWVSIWQNRHIRHLHDGPIKPRIVGVIQHLYPLPHISYSHSQTSAQAQRKRYMSTLELFPYPGM